METYRIIYIDAFVASQQPSDHYTGAISAPTEKEAIEYLIDFYEERQGIVLDLSTKDFGESTLLETRFM